MNKKLFALIAILVALCFFVACMDSDDDVVIDEEWKAYNEQQVKDVAANPDYEKLNSATENGAVYWKPSDVITNSMKSEKITKEGYPYLTDSVHVRYKGWYYNKDGDEVVFDTTEGTSNGYVYKTRVNKVIPGWADMLTNMKEGEEVEVCIPYELAYGTYGSGSIPGYTTLRFYIKLLKIIPDNPGEFD